MGYGVTTDIYFLDGYAKLYEKIENGMAEKIEVSNEHGKIVSHVIKREIPLQLGEKYYDLVTPYGYGGPIIVSLTGDKSELIKSFETKMNEYVKENHIVSEFIRFHPIVENALDFQSIYHVQFDRKTVGTDVSHYSMEEEFSKSAKKCIRRALKAGVTYEIIVNPKEVDDFKKVYYSTMDRDNADKFYYFDDTYFDSCLKELGEHVIYVKVFYEEKVIAAGFYFFYEQILQCHLSGTRTEYLDLSPAYVIKMAVAKWAEEHNIRYIHYGGGTSRSEDNGVYQFKKKFGQKTSFDFYVGRKIWNKDVYAKAVEMREKELGCRIESDYFPRYRVNTI